MTVQPALPATAHPVAVTLNTIIEEVSDRFVERRQAIFAAVLAILAKEHMFMLGPPGTAKTTMIKDLFKRIDGCSYFAATLSKTRPAEAILGPYDIPLLRDTGDLHRRINGFLPTADYAMLDETWKMSPTLGHDLLNVVLDRELDQVNGGRSQVDVPLRSFFGGSNELPEGDDQQAMYDRTLVRVIVDYIQETGNWIHMLKGSVEWTGTETVVDFKALADVIDNVVPTIDIPMDAWEAMARLRDALHQLEIYPSDRRWKACVKLLRASAFLQGRNQVEEDDLQVLRYALWDTPQQVTAVERATLSIANPAAKAAMSLLDDIEEIARGIRDLKGQSSESRAAYGTEASGKLKLILTDLQQKRQEMIAAGRSVTKLDEVNDKLAAVKRSLYVDLLDMDPSILRNP